MGRSVLIMTAIAALTGTAMAAPGDTLVGDPFITGYNGWTDVSLPTVNGAAPNWGIHLRDGALQEASDGDAGRGTTGATSSTADGKYTPYMMINNFVTPTDYTFSSVLQTYDDDGFGVVFGAQDNKNYFRVGLRAQTNGNLGFGQGISVQKVVNGTITQLAGPNTGFIPTASLNPATFTNINLDVKVQGTSWGVYVNGGATPILSGTDADLQPGKIGVHSWNQLQTGTTNAQWGTQLRSVAVKDAAGASVFTDNFGTVSQSAVSPVPWRTLLMTPTVGNGIQDADDYGNFKLDFRRGSIVEDSNGFNNASTGAPNVDFTAPAIVVNSPGSATFSDYEMKVRMKNADNDGIGVLLRVQDDNTFYRLTFHQDAQAIGAGRPPRGLSVQKDQGGVWTELYRDDQSNPFLYTPGTPFDLDVTVIGGKISIKVINDPAGAATLVTFPDIVDATNPLLTGSVGFMSWGNGDAGTPAMWLPYGGIAGTPLLTEVPEPATCVLAVSGMLFLMRRRSARQA